MKAGGSCRGPLKLALLQEMEKKEAPSAPEDLSVWCFHPPAIQVILLGTTATCSAYQVCRLVSSQGIPRGMIFRQPVPPDSGQYQGCVACVKRNYDKFCNNSTVAVQLLLVSGWNNIGERGVSISIFHLNTDIYQLLLHSDIWANSIVLLSHTWKNNYCSWDLRVINVGCYLLFSVSSLSA